MGKSAVAEAVRVEEYADFEAHVRDEFAFIREEFARVHKRLDAHGEAIVRLTDLTTEIIETLQAISDRLPPESA